MKTIKHILLLAFVTVATVACNDKFDNPKKNIPETDGNKDIITIKQLKERLWVYLNDPDLEKFTSAYETAARGVIIPDDVYIKGQVISDDREGNFYKALWIQDGTSGITIKLDRTGLYNFYKLGQWIYIRCQDLALGYYRGMYEIGDRPDPDRDEALGPYRYMATYIPPSKIDRHILVGEQGIPIQPEVLTMNQIMLDADGKTNMKLGTLVKINNLNFTDTDLFLGNLYLDFDDPDLNRNGRRVGIYVDTSRFVPADVIPTWALPAAFGQILGGEKAVDDDSAKIVFAFNANNPPVPVTHSWKASIIDWVPIFVPTTMALTVTHNYAAPGRTETLGLRTSGYSRFAGQPRSSGGNFVGIVALYTSRSGGFPKYQLTLRDLNDVNNP